VGEPDPNRTAAKGVAPGSEKSASDHAKQFVAGLTEEDIMLLRLRDELYDGRWESMLADLRDRLQGKPYVFRLAHPIQEDIDRIERLSRFERQHNVNLAAYIGR
jgi:hypothetical protein